MDGTILNKDNVLDRDKVLSKCDCCMAKTSVDPCKGCSFIFCETCMVTEDHTGYFICKKCQKPWCTLYMYHMTENMCVMCSMGEA